MVNIATFESLDGAQALVMQKLLSHQVRFIVVGGYAVKYYGYQRVTKDLDLVIAQTEENIDLIRNALQPNAAESAWNQLLLPEKKLCWWNVEIFSTMRGLTYVDMEKSANLYPLFGSSVRILSVSHLMAAKSLALNAADRDEIQRTQDELDLKYLQGLEKI